MKLQTNSAVILVFGREPRPGRVKTRLIPALGKRQATALYRQMLERTLRVAATADVGQRQLWLDAGDAALPAYPPAQALGFTVHRQQGHDIGERMQHALHGALQGADRAVLIGSDCPEYGKGYLDAAISALADHDAVVGPAVDGGYVLIGLRRTASGLFGEIPWSTAGVMAATRLRLRALQWRWQELPQLRDIDRPDDLRFFPDLASLAPAADV